MKRSSVAAPGTLLGAAALFTLGASTIGQAGGFGPGQSPGASSDAWAVIDHLEAMAGASLGPPGGEVRALVVAPTDPNRILLGTATGHVYGSHDAGESWQDLDIGLPHEAVVDNLLIHPGNVEVMFAAYWEPRGTGGLMVSRDGGASWVQSDDLGVPSLRAIAMAPSDARVVYVGGIGGVWRSDDGGSSWHSVNGTGLATDFVESLAIDPRDPDHVYAGTWRQVYRSRDGGATWSRIYQGMAVDRDVFTLAISPHDPDVVFAGTCNYLYCSTNAGGSWGERRGGLSADHNRVHEIIHDPTTPEILYAGTRGGLYRSTDAGINWTIMLGGVSVSAIALDPTAENIYVGTEERGVLAGPVRGTLRERNQGLNSSRVVAFDALPGAPRVMFAARQDGPTDTTVLFTTDTGRMWRPLGTTPTVGEILTVRAQAEPVNRVLVVGELGWWSAYPAGRWASVPAAPGALVDLEIAHEAGGEVFAATDSGIYVADAGTLGESDGASRAFDSAPRTTWRSVSRRPIAAMTIAGNELLAVGGGSVVRGRLDELAAGTPARTATTDGLPDEVVGLALHPHDHDIAYAITRTDVFRSGDGGIRWQRLPIPWPAAELRAIAVDPANPDQVLALDHRGALYRGHGDGEHWLILDDDEGLDRAWTLRMSAAAPGFALVATHGHGLRVIRLNPLQRAANPATDSGASGASRVPEGLLEFPRS